uniref:Homologous recombination OB-fold protein OB-fold domain-containing protein n=1 Tax=Tanacetum cinerariifolium TaxID=118510 RepID=A0A699IDK4_TANCI|nr:hypothetical protein [Tanacetum cinerariifolium]
MACSLPHIDDEVEALVQKLIDEDMVRQKAILDLALQFENACTTKDNLRKAYTKCNDIPQESRALIEAFLKEGFDKDYELNLFMYGKTEKIEKQMNAKLVWLLEKYNYRSQTHIDEKALRETSKEQARDEKEQEEKIRQKQAEDKEFMSEFRVKFDLDYETCVEPSPSTPNPVRIIPNPAGIVQQPKLLKKRDILLGWDEAVMSTQEYMKKIVEDVGDDDDFESGLWVSATDYVHATGGIVTGLTVKDLLGTIPRTIHHKVIGDDGYGKYITVRAAMILSNVSVFTPKPSKHYLNITIRHVVKVFRKDRVLENGSG